MNAPAFFTHDDFTHFATIANQPYIKGNPNHLTAKNRLMAGVWAKTEYWANRVEAALPDYQVDAFRKVWSQRKGGGSKTSSIFKPYTWARIVKRNAANRDVYFTVGIDATLNIIIIKLDYQRLGTTSLTDDQKNICSLNIMNNNGGWKYIQAITLENLTDFNWNNLIPLTTKFIKEHEEQYLSVLNLLTPISSKNRIARLVWNTNGWVMPSGPEGKSNDINSHEGSYGYGHEEWLLDLSKVIDGYHYGFLEPLRKQQGAYEGKLFNIQLYSINKETKKRYWIGEIKNTEVLDSGAAELVKAEYQRLGWFQEMEDQIVASGANEEGFSDWQGVELFNIRFKPEDAEIYDEYIEIDNDNPLVKASRYTFIKNESKFQAPKVIQPFHFQTPSETDVESDQEEPSYRTVSHQAPKTVEIDLFHKRISNNLCTYLRTIYGNRNVKAEHPAGTGSNRIDIVVQENTDFLFYEIKTYSSIKACIREAIGQILEYSYFPTKSVAKELIIVSQHKADNTIQQYMAHLRTTLNIPLYYQQFDMTSKVLSDKY